MQETLRELDVKEGLRQKLELRERYDLTSLQG